ncbi:aldo/keto reductase [Pseudanabaena sp. PCC 6802]|uniref:aldo/keto reductase n=1 Tax=Pseudanabaena sp. PCC 6802 TaxID=118173 RepID=UPI000379BF48|nr:aldo/keto reductase [Pseudanabaena sp. PCC 6802]
MQTIKLGSSGLSIPPLGIGTWAWGDKLFWNYGKDYGEAQVKDAFKAALDAGINFFDTAEVYGLGESERLLGQFARGNKQPICIATKYMPVPWRINAKAVKDAVTASLERLQVKKIDLYQVHQPISFMMNQKTLMNALADEVKQGRIVAVGVSNYSAEQMREAHKLLRDRGIPLAVNQVKYSLLDRQIETNGILDAARSLGVKILAYGPLAQGLLTGKYTSTQTPTGARQLDARFGNDNLFKVEPLLKLLRQTAEQHNGTLAQVALNWLIAKGVVPIPGAKNAEQVRQNAGALNWQLLPEEVSILDRASLEWRK